MIKMLWAGLLSLLASTMVLATKPTVASMNLCTDRLVLALADLEQIVSLSHVATDPDSMVEPATGDIPLNHGRLEQMLALEADLVVASDYDSPRVLERLVEFGRDIEIFTTANSLEAAVSNIRRMAELLQQPERGEQAVEAIQAIGLLKPVPDHPRTLIMGAGGYISGQDSLASHLIEGLGYDNLADEAAIDEYGQVSMEQAIMLAPEVLVINQYSDAYSRPQALLDHPALDFLGQSARIIHVPTREWICADTALPLAAARLIQ